MDKDLFIFVTGVVGRAMGSGKFTPGDIGFLTKEAKLAFEDSFGAPAPSIEGKFYNPGDPIPAQVGSAQHIGVTAEKIVAAAAGGVAPAGFDAWKDLKAYYGSHSAMLNGKPMRENTWAELFQTASHGNKEAARALQVMSKPPDPQSKWYDKDKEKSERAFQLLAMLKR